MKWGSPFIGTRFVKRTRIVLITFFSVVWVYSEIDMWLFEQQVSRASQRSTRDPDFTQENYPRLYFPLNEEEEVLGDPYEITALSAVQVRRLIEGKYRRSRFVAEGVMHPIIYKKKDISFSVLSPNGRRIGFFYEPDDSGPFQIVLAVMDVETQHVMRVYQAPMPRTSGWAWKDNDHVFVYRNCGTACRIIDVINVTTGEHIDSYHDIEYERSTIEMWCDDPCPLLEQYDAEQARVK